MSNILFLNMNMNSISKTQYNNLKKGQLKEYASNIEEVFKVIDETNCFEKDKPDNMNDCLSLLQECYFLAEQYSELLSNPLEKLKLSQKYSKYFDKKYYQKYITLKLAAMYEFDKEFDNILKEQLEDINEIIKEINLGKATKDWVFLYDFFKLMKDDNLANLLKQTMQGRGVDVSNIDLQNDKAQKQ